MSDKGGHVVGNGVTIFDTVIENLCPEIKLYLSKIPGEYKENVEEIRLRNGSPLSIYCNNRDYFINNLGNVQRSTKGSIIVNEVHISKSFQLITNYSVYAFQEEIKNGFITIRGGHRVGIGGKVIYGSGGIENINNISSLNIRIGREKIGISDHIIEYLLDNNKDFYNTLIISSPQCGKTTLLRDIVRNLSNGDFCQGAMGFKVSVVDERSEIAGVYKGRHQKDIGIRTDILDGCLKSDGIMMLIRSMSPQIIAVDEIGGDDDIKAIGNALRAGIKLIATIHGSSLEEVRQKPSLRELFEEDIFKRFIILDRSYGVGTIKEILDNNQRVLYREGRL